jgi:ribonuclease HI
MHQSETLNKSTSIITIFLSTGQAPLIRKHDRMISLSHKLPLANKSARPPLIIPIKPQGIEQPIHFTIEFLDQLSETTIPSWITNFRELSEMAAWPSTTGLLILKSALAPDLWNSIKQKQSLTTALDALAKETFPADKQQDYFKELSTISQDQHAYISDYIEAIKQAAYKWGSAASASKTEQEKQISLQFFNGLNVITKLEMTRLNLTLEEEIITKIQSMEKLIEKLPISSMVSTQQGTQPTSYTPKLKITKWCTFHKSPHHSDEECQRRLPKSKEKTTKSNLHLIRENTSQLEEIRLEGQINNKPIETLLDTGARNNYMSKELAENLNLEIKDTTDNRTVELGNGSNTNIIGTVECKLKLNKFSNYVFSEQFHVINSTLSEILLGSPFLNRNDILIDYREKKLRIVDETLFLINEDLQDNPDTQIIDKIRYVNQTLKEKCLKTISDLERDSDKLGLVPNEEFKIRLTEHQPIRCRPYPIPEKIRKRVDDEIDRLLSTGVIRKAKHTYFSAPAFPIIKKTGDIRLVVDYRKINAITLKEASPFPNLHEELTSIAPGTVFSQLDLKQGYHQIAVEEESKKFTAFVISNGHYEYNRVPFGLCNAPRIFQNIMRNILGHLKYIRIFLDDILVVSKNETEHCSHLLEVLSILKTNNLTISFSKSSFFKEEVIFLGHIISKEGIRPDTSRIKGLEEFPEPTSRKKLLQLLGLINWFRPFIKNLSQRIHSITEKTKQDVPFTWSKEDQLIITEILNTIKEATLLARPDYTIPFTLEVDGSERAIGGVLYQQNKVIGIYSKKLSPAQQNYTNTERELLAIIEALKYFRNIIYCADITVKTDHANLLYSTELQSSRAQRWKLVLEDYQVKIMHIAGKDNQAADALSRCAHIKTVPLIPSKEEIQALIKRTGNLTDSGKYAIPAEQAQETVKKLHLFLGHCGINTFIRTISNVLEIPKLRKLITNERKQCNNCQHHQIGKSNYGTLTGTLQESEPFKNLAADIIGPMPTEAFAGSHTKQKFWLLTVTDRCTHWSELFILYDLKPATILNHFETWFKGHGKPKTILTDNGRQFTSSEFQTKMSVLEIKSILCSPYSPTSNGTAERINQVIRFTLAHFSKLSIKQATLLAERKLQYCFHRGMHSTPYELVFHEHPLIANNSTPCTSLQQAIESNTQLSEESRNTANQKRITTWKPKPGALVFKRSHEQGKLSPRWIGPYEIKGVSKNQMTILLTNNKHETQTNIRHIRPL